MKKFLYTSIILFVAVFQALAQDAAGGTSDDNTVIDTNIKLANIGQPERNDEKLYRTFAIANYRVPFNIKFTALHQEHHGITVLNTFSKEYYPRDVDTITPALGWLAFAVDGDWKMLMNKNGQLHIGSSYIPNFRSGTSTYALENTHKLYVEGGIRTESLKIDLKTSWPDYVFNPEYILTPLPEVETFIKTQGHLPNTPSAESIKQNGLDVNEILTLHMEKIEELTLYIIQLQKEIEELKK